ncbi:MAG: hypothetical protein EOO24_25175 [Comamonadaceae bacterium]|nr:MAG: hypothetical protein EOO24_25175 [Comamonadaceae bacterium]
MKLNIVPARTGIQWVKLGIQTFFRQPLALAGLFFMYMAAVLVLGAVPVLGPVVVMVLMPAATLGMMVATEHATQGRFPMPSVLVSAFRAGRQRGRAMLVLGMIYAVVLVGISLLASLLFPGGIAVQATEGAAAGAPQIQVQPGFLFAGALQLPFVVLFSHAPALVHWHGISPVKSLFFSAIAFWRNFGAFVVFGIGWLLVLIAVGLGFSLLFALVGGGISGTLMLPVTLLVITMMATSMYFSFRDSFQASPDEPPAALPQDPTP